MLGGLENKDNSVNILLLQLPTGTELGNTVITVNTGENK